MIEAFIAPGLFKCRNSNIYLRYTCYSYSIRSNTDYCEEADENDDSMCKFKFTNCPTNCTCDLYLSINVANIIFSIITAPHKNVLGIFVYAKLVHPDGATYMTGVGLNNLFVIS